MKVGRQNQSFPVALRYVEQASDLLWAKHTLFGVPGTFADALIAHARLCQVTKMSDSKFGAKYQIDGPLSCPDGRSPAIRAVWIVDSGTNFSRLVTAHPLE